MRRSLMAILTAVAGFAAVPAQAGEWGFMPVANDPAYKPNMAVALKGGMLDADVPGADASFAYGVELSLDCPLLRTPVGKIRQQLSWNRMDEDGLELNTLELNPHYVVEMAKDLWVGAGPGVGYVWADHSTGRGANMWAVQAGASATYTMGHALIGLESRYQWTEGDDVGTGSKGADNWLTMAKVGYKF